MKLILIVTFKAVLLLTCSSMLMAADFDDPEKSDMAAERHTEVSIQGEKFYINGKPTYEGQAWRTSYGGDYPVEGLLMNARLVQGIFDDQNESTRGQWAYPDTGEWDPDRNTDEFIRAMASWLEHGLLAFTLNLQGGCPYGYCSGFPWDNSSYNPDGSLREAFMRRAERILDQADQLGMVVILGLFYFGEDGTLQDENAVKQAVRNAVNWVLDKGYTNVIIEINNECSVRAYDHDILRCHRVHELITIARNIEHDGRRLYVSTSLAGGGVPPDNIVGVSDFVLIHGNGVQDPARITEISRVVREKEAYRPMPLVNNEDDIPWRNEDQGWGESGNNFVASVKSYTGWGYFDFRRPIERYDYNQGFQSIPVNWQISSDRKRDFFRLLAEVTGSPGTPKIDISFSGRIGESMDVAIGEGPENINVRKLELIINNQTVAESMQIPAQFHMDEIEKNFMAADHWIKARLTYDIAGRVIVVESPYYRNPWWPYGGLVQE
jgi:hypothetical protein